MSPIAPAWKFRPLPDTISLISTLLQLMCSQSYLDLKDSGVGVEWFQEIAGWLDLDPIVAPGDTNTRLYKHLQSMDT